MCDIQYPMQYRADLALCVCVCQSVLVIEFASLACRSYTQTSGATLDHGLILHGALKNGYATDLSRLDAIPGSSHCSAGNPTSNETVAAVEHLVKTIPRISEGGR
jgi:hypothetical protein